MLILELKAHQSVRAKTQETRGLPKAEENTLSILNIYI